MSSGANVRKISQESKEQISLSTFRKLLGSLGVGTASETLRASGSQRKLSGLQRSRLLKMPFEVS